MAVPFNDLQTQYRNLKTQIDKAVLRTLDSTQYCLGQEVEKFEDNFSSYCKTNYCSAVNSGTSALHLALISAGVSKGDEVITTPFTFVATTAAILYIGAKPVFVDIDPRTCNISPNQIEKAITPKTGAILPVHLWGQPADLAPILELGKEYGIPVIEDAAQAHGAEYKGSRCGSLGDIGCFSFYPGKNLGAYGEGGAVTSNNRVFIEKIKQLRDWGQKKRHHHSMLGYNYRMDGIQGAILAVKLQELEKWTEARRLVADTYNKAFQDIIEIPYVIENVRHVYHVYALRSPKRNTLQNYLNDRNIASGIHYPIPVHLQAGYSELGYKQGDFPHTEKAASEVLSLPIFPDMTKSQQEEVIDAVTTWCKKES